MQVVDMQLVFDGVQSDVIGRANRLPSTHASPGHPHRESVGVMVATIAFFTHRSAAKFFLPDDQRPLQQAAAARSWSSPATGRSMLWQSLEWFFSSLESGIPAAAGAVVQLHEPHTPLDQAPGRRRLRPKYGFGLIDSIQPLFVSKFLCQSPPASGAEDCMRNANWSLAMRASVRNCRVPPHVAGSTPAGAPAWRADGGRREHPAVHTGDEIGCSPGNRPVPWSTAGINRDSARRTADTRPA